MADILQMKFSDIFADYVFKYIFFKENITEFCS